MQVGDIVKLKTDTSQPPMQWMVQEIFTGSDESIYLTIKNQFGSILSEVKDTNVVAYAYDTNAEKWAQATSDMGNGLSAIADALSQGLGANLSGAGHNVRIITNTLDLLAKTFGVRIDAQTSSTTTTDFTRLFPLALAFMRRTPAGIIAQALGIALPYALDALTPDTTPTEQNIFDIKSEMFSLRTLIQDSMSQITLALKPLEHLERIASALENHLPTIGASFNFQGVIDALLAIDNALDALVMGQGNSGNDEQATFLLEALNTLVGQVTVALEHHATATEHLVSVSDRTAMTEALTSITSTLETLTRNTIGISYLESIKMLTETLVTCLTGNGIGNAIFNATGIIVALNEMKTLLSDKATSFEQKLEAFHLTSKSLTEFFAIETAQLNPNP